LIEPARTAGGSRRYSERDIELLQHIQELTNEGVGLAGVRRILELEAALADARAEIEHLGAELERTVAAAAAAVRAAHREHRRDLVPLSKAVVRAPRREWRS
jgi:MerR family transcriptional regulator, heat shock protein HspR